MKTLTIEISYREDTRELKTLLTAKEFIPELPDNIITAQQVDTVTLFAGRIMTNNDLRAVNGTLAKTLSTLNGTLVQWAAAVATKDMGGQLSASAIDPVAIFDTALQPPE